LNAGFRFLLLSDGREVEFIERFPIINRIHQPVDAALAPP
jgi:hypothetical protein